MGEDVLFHAPKFKVGDRVMLDPVKTRLDPPWDVLRGAYATILPEPANAPYAMRGGGWWVQFDKPLRTKANGHNPYWYGDDILLLWEDLLTLVPVPQCLLEITVP